MIVPIRPCSYVRTCGLVWRRHSRHEGAEEICQVGVSMLIPLRVDHRPAAERDYPRSYAELRGWFDQDWTCRDYLDWLRWPDGFVCPGGGSGRGWRLADGRWKCCGCQRKVSATAGTIFYRTRTPLTVWFAVAWRLVGDKVGISATKYSFPGGPEPGVRGRGALGKVLLADAVERTAAGKPRRGRLAVIDDASADSLGDFLRDNVEPGSRIITDGWRFYPAATREGYTHKPTSVAAFGLQAHQVLPAAHRSPQPRPAVPHFAAPRRRRRSRHAPVAAQGRTISARARPTRRRPPLARQPRRRTPTPALAQVANHIGVSIWSRLCQSRYHMDHPPSTTHSTPVTKEASFEHRKLTTLATSSGAPSRPTGVALESNSFLD